MFGAVACVISMGIFLAFSCKANPYVDPINDKMEMVDPWQGCVGYMSVFPWFLSCAVIRWNTPNKTRILPACFILFIQEKCLFMLAKKLIIY